MSQASGRFPSKTWPSPTLTCLPISHEGLWLPPPPLSLTPNAGWLPSFSTQMSASLLVSFFLPRAAISLARTTMLKTLRGLLIALQGRDHSLYSPAQPHSAYSPSSLPCLLPLSAPAPWHLRTFAQTVPQMGLAHATLPQPRATSSLSIHPRDLLIPGKSGICYQAQRASPGLTEPTWTVYCSCTPAIGSCCRVGSGFSAKNTP